MARKGLKSQSGAIMLEVIAVLSLMGLMGTMLFRQIYLRNQELHNIQMASEIRVIKDAFAAWIQANSVVLGSRCPVEPGKVKSCNPIPPGGRTLEGEIAQFLPDGYFAGDGGIYLSSNYDFSIWGYLRGVEGSGDLIRTFYGIVVPKPNVLPDGGSGDTWNFRRAARVAMLIGIDGGAYGHGITVDTDGSTPVIAGAVGAWNLPIEGIITDDNNSKTCGEGGGNYCPTYVAMTGLDVFQPEIELPAMQVRMDEDMNLALQRTHVYGAFTAGGIGDSCYTITHTNVTAGPDGVYVLHGDNVKNVSDNCMPAFYVEDSTESSDGKGTGTVRVRNDLTVGQSYDGSGPTTAAIRFDKSGMIVFENDKKHDIQTDKDINYVLDPAYTSVMNDVKIMSRGGARLSEILPRYILKEVKELSSSTVMSGKVYWKIDIPKDYCPKGYKLAIAAHPTMWEGATITDKKLKVSVPSGSSGGDVDVKYSSGVPGPGDDKVVADIKGTKRAVYIGTNNCETAPGSVTHVDDINTSDGAKTYYVCFGHVDEGGATFTADASAGVAYLYCVFNEYDSALVNSGYNDKDSCEKTAGLKWHVESGGGKCYNIPQKGRPRTAELCAKFKEEDMCTYMECHWNGSTCEMPAGVGGS